jgi:hypothetical protein
MERNLARLAAFAVRGGLQHGTVVQRINMDASGALT